MNLKERIKKFTGLSVKRIVLKINGGIGMLDKLAMIAMLILYIVVGIVVLFTSLLVRGENENKTEWEQFQENDEQMNYLKEQINRRKK